MKWLLTISFIGGASICVASFWCASYAFDDQWARLLITAFVGVAATAFLSWIAHESDQPGWWAIVIGELVGFSVACALIMLSRGNAFWL